jgi:radical SAM superfamily enzyme YgiQ (UPF0313 family)
MHDATQDRPGDEASLAAAPGVLPPIVFLGLEGAFVPGASADDKLVLGAGELGWLAEQMGQALPAGFAAAPAADVVARAEGLLARRQGRTGFVVASTAPPEPDEVAGLDGYVGPYRTATPTSLVVSPHGFDFLHHDGRLRLRLDVAELVAAIPFVHAIDVHDALARQREALGTAALDDQRFARLVARLITAGVIVALADDASHAAEGRLVREFRRGVALQHKRTAAVQASLARHRESEAAREAESGQRRVKVVPVNSEGNPLLSLGLLMSYAQVYEGGKLNEGYQFVPDWADQTVPKLTADDPPAVYLFSNYIWSHAWNVVRSAEVKERNPRSITIHGGPNTPKYDDDIQQFFRTNPQVDITVHGEGEASLAHVLDVLQSSMLAGEADRERLRDVPGISFRMGEEIVHNGPRDRIAELDSLPSPYLDGLFDSVGGEEISLMTIESNRGCPYGCTYCDWGSATLSRIRKFDLDRVFEELEWCARHKVETVFNADANFGIFSRDVDIARKLVELKEQYGYPKRFESSYAKNTVKHLREIIEILANGDILSTGTLSLQSVDPGTLDAIHRSNIRVDKYDDLAVEFGKLGLPLVVELMMGLPGSTMTSFLGDLQQCIDREVKSRVNPTEVLMNSPMNDPEYRGEHAIATLRPVTQDWSEANSTRKKALVVSTSTFSREEYDRMERYRRAFLFFENYAIGRQISRFVRQETGRTEMELYTAMVDEVHEHPQDWPALSFVLEVIVQHMVPPASWSLFLDDVRRFVTTRFGVADDSALETALAVQLAVIPARERAYPETVALAHDFAAWHAAMLEAKHAGHAADWTERVPRLSTYGPATFTVTDEQEVSSLGLGMSLLYDTDSDWELASPVARPMRFRHTTGV